jgi:hypothetical protein
MRYPAQHLLPHTAPVAAWARPIVVGIQRGTIAMGGATATATIQPVDVSNCVIRFSGCFAPFSDNRQLMAMVELTNPTTVTATRTNTNTFVTNIGFEVTEYRPGVIRSIQRGKTVCVAGTTNPTISAVTDLAKTSCALLGWSAATNLANDSALFPSLRLSAPTTITIFINAVDVHTVGWQVTEWY